MDKYRKNRAGRLYSWKKMPWAVHEKEKKKAVKEKKEAVKEKGIEEGVVVRKRKMPDDIDALAAMGKTLPRAPVYPVAMPGSLNKLLIKKDGIMTWDHTQDTVWVNIAKNSFARGGMREAFKMDIVRGVEGLSPTGGDFVAKRTFSQVAGNASFLEKVSLQVA